MTPILNGPSNATHTVIEVWGLMGVVIALLLLIYLAYRGISVLLLSPLMALLAILFAQNHPVLATYTQIFMPAVGHFIVLYFPLFLLGAIFGKLMDDSGSAKMIAHGMIKNLGSHNGLLAVVLACAILTYGGVSLFVVAFAIFPIADALFKEANMPKRLIPATIALGAFTFTMTALPGTPAIQNAIPMPYFGTTSFAAPALGIIAAIIMFGAGQWWLTRQAIKAAIAGEGYGNHQATTLEVSPAIRALSQGEGFDMKELGPSLSQGYPDRDFEKTSLFFLALAPIVLVICLNYAISTFVLPALNTSYLATPLYGDISLNDVRGVWSIIVSLSCACLFIIGVHWRRFEKIRHTLDSGANAAVIPIFNTASLVGFGAVIAKLPAFSIIQNLVETIGGGPLVSLAVSVNILAGITGSASGGMSIALQALGEQYLIMAQHTGIAPEILHRITTIATGGLDSLPHNGAVVTLLSICGLTHRKAYKDIFFVAVIFPLIALSIVVALGSLWPTRF